MLPPFHGGLENDGCKQKDDSLPSFGNPPKVDKEANRKFVAAGALSSRLKGVPATSKTSSKSVPKRLQKRLPAPRYPIENKRAPCPTHALLTEGL